MKSIVVKLWLVFTATILLILFFIWFVISQLYQDFYYKEQTAQLVQYGQILSDVVVGQGEVNDTDIAMIEKLISARTMVVDKTGLVLACNGMMGMRKGMRLEQAEVSKVLRGEIVTKVGYNDRLGIIVLSAAVPIKIDTITIGAVLLYKPVESIEKNISEIRKIITLAAVIAVLFSTVLAFFLSKRLSRPLLMMKNAALAMAEGRFEENLAIESKDEIGLLATSMNNLANKLKETLAALNAEKDTLANVLASMSDAVITFNLSGEVLMHNKAAEDILPHLLHLTSQENWKHAFAATANTKNVSVIDWSAGEKDYHVTLAPLPGNSGLVTVFHEITREKRLERLRKEFVANVTHELRTPLSLMQGYAEALLDFGDDPSERAKYSQIILDETKRLSGLVNELLELTKAENKRLEIKKQIFDFKKFLERCINEYEGICREKGISLELETEGDFSKIFADEAKLKQVILNYLDNACRHSKENGKIIIDARCIGESLKVSIKDFGEGIPESDLPFVWERFYRVDKSRQRGTGGTGLGLAIVKNIIEAHKGEVFVESKEGEYTKFGFIIPIKEE